MSLTNCVEESKSAWLIFFDSLLFDELDLELDPPAHEQPFFD